MKICYYPGCTLKTKAKDLDVYARRSAAALGVEMEEIENWQCCGAVYPMAKDEIATKLSAVRALEYAKRNGGKLLTRTSSSVQMKICAAMKIFLSRPIII